MDTIPELQELTDEECCDFMDSLDSKWYFEWCEREGSMLELRKHLYQLTKQEP